MLRTALLVILLLTATVARTEAGYVCRQPHGGMSAQDTPCATGEPLTWYPSGPASTVRLPAQAVPPPLSPASPTPQEKAQPINCLEVGNVSSRVLTETRHTVTVSWRVAVQNRCANSVTAQVQFLLIDGQEYELGHAWGNVIVKEGDENTATGTLLVKPEAYRQARRSFARVRW